MPRQKTTTAKAQDPLSQAQPKKSRHANGEGSVRKRSEGRVEIKVSLPDGKQKSVYGKTRRDISFW